MANIAFSSIKDNNLEQLKALLEANPALVSSRNDQGVSLLMMSLYYRLPKFSDLILSFAGPVDLFESAALGDSDRISQWLEDQPELLNEFTTDGFTSLHLAVFMGRADATELLLACGARIDLPASNPSFVLPLHSAVAGGNDDCVRYLLQAGAAVNVKQHGGYTPLMGAALSGNIGMVQMLLVAGADQSLVDEANHTARDHALTRGHEALAAFLA